MDLDFAKTSFIYETDNHRACVQITGRLSSEENQYSCEYLSTFYGTKYKYLEWPFLFEIISNIYECFHARE